DASGNRLVALGRAELLGEIFVAADALARYPVIEKIRPPMDLDRDVRAQFQRLLQPALADEAPRTHHVGDDIDREGSSHEAPSGKRDQQKWRPGLASGRAPNKQPERMPCLTRPQPCADRLSAPPATPPYRARGMGRARPSARDACARRRPQASCA